MSEETPEESAGDEQRETPPQGQQEEDPTVKARKKKARQKFFRYTFGLLIVIGAVLLIPAVRFGSEKAWDSNAMLATYILSGIIIAGVLAVLVLLNVARTRYSVEQRILEHREVHEYVILWDRPRWVLYFPTLVLAIVFGIYVLLQSWHLVPEVPNREVLGGIWVSIAILNALVEQFHMSIKAVLILVPTIGALLLLLHLVGYADDAIRLVRYLCVEVTPKLYFMAAGVIAFVIFIGWIHGLFHYLAITPNVADLQRGLTETGRQIKNQDYDVDFDATDVVERWLFGFGRIIISFQDPNRPPMVFFVPHASNIDERIRRVRSVTAIDRYGEE
ncbi:MAG: hypothetical protein KGZ25_15190 [Planctomycetes bacterium]|nr:hypothetical protein [Planctomycetota bacterium]